MPNVFGLQGSSAEARLREDSLGAVRRDSAAEYGQRGTVLAQVPAGGDTVARGTVVRLTIGVWVLPRWFKVALTIAGLGLLAGVIHRIWRRPPPPSPGPKQPDPPPKYDDEKFRRRSRFVLQSDAAGAPSLPDSAEPTGRPELGLAPRMDPGEQTIEGDGP